MKSLLKQVIAVAVLILCSMTYAQADIINMDAGTYYSDNHLIINLSPGTYRLDPIGTASGGEFDAWNAWGSWIVNCDPDGTHCDKGWSNYYEIYIPSTDITYLNFPDNNYYASAELALSNAQSYTFTIDVSDNIEIYTRDTYAFDNQGGLSFNLVTAPEPVSSLLFCAGGVILGGRRLFRSNNS